MPAPVPPRFLTDQDPGDEAVPILDLDVVYWRFERLEDAGYPVDVAIELAKRADIDLHRACDLLERGAKLADALDILL